MRFVAVAALGNRLGLPRTMRDIPVGCDLLSAGRLVICSGYQFIEWPVAVEACLLGGCICQAGRLRRSCCSMTPGLENTHVNKNRDRDCTRTDKYR